MIKKIWLLLFTLLLVTTPVMSQVRPDTSSVTIPRSLLTSQQLEAANQTARIETYGKWVGLGKEVGEAVNGSLAAVTDQTSKFADTNVGKFTMFIILWKVLGDDLLGVIFAISVGTIGWATIVWSYRRYTPTAKVLIKEEYDSVTKKTNKIYKPVEEMFTGEDLLWLRLFHAFGALIILAAISFATFS